MYCPNCGQQQASNEMRFCSRCGLALSGLADWLAGDRIVSTATPAVSATAPATLPSPRRKKHTTGSEDDVLQRRNLSHFPDDRARGK